ncbi:MAG: cupin domain-containing protein [Planctomycetota bacterium]|jgi:quercetin dioxygenase-like cupin family protein|nr:cupin domain-containing protein [Planctomycetota bacterium]
MAADKAGEVVKINVEAMEWEAEFNPPTGKNLFKKSLFKDPGTGVGVTITKYPAGFINPKHDHPCAHGMYVLKGILHTSEGDFPPGSFVWFPEGSVMWHGATAEQDVEIVFITNKKFAINYL